MHKQIHEKPVKKVRRVESYKVDKMKNKPNIHGDVDDFIYGDKKTSPSNR